MTTAQNNTVHPHIHLQTYARGVVEKCKNVVVASGIDIDRPAMRTVRGTIMFWSFLHNRNRRKALKWHRKVQEYNYIISTHEMREEILSKAANSNYWH